MPYRPEGFENPKLVLEEVSPDESNYNAGYLAGHEAGADAMLEALVEAQGKQAVKLTFDDKAGTVLSFDIQATQRGTVVFIPEEE